MFIKSILGLIVLTQSLVVQAAVTQCPPNSPKKIQLKSKFHDSNGSGYRYYVFCDNVDAKGCNQNLVGPYLPGDKQLCHITSETDEANVKTVNYDCDSTSGIYDFKKSAESNKWKCALALS